MKIIQFKEVKKNESSLNTSTFSLRTNFEFFNRF